MAEWASEWSARWEHRHHGWDAHVDYEEWNGEPHTGESMAVFIEDDDGEAAVDPVPPTPDLYDPGPWMMPHGSAICVAGTRSDDVEET